MTTTAGYARGFFDLQLDFAAKVSALAGVPLASALMDDTNLYVRFGLGREFDPAHPVWRRYLTGLQSADDAGDWTYRFFLTRPHAVAPPALVASFGCFSYGRLGDGRIRLHFRNADTQGGSPLAPDRRDRRRADLAALFAHVAASASRPPIVVGASWLYNLDAYRRLFPASYLATARAIHPFRTMPLWGQFLDRNGEIRQDMACRFRARLARQASMDGVERCFPLPALSLQASAQAFYDLYGIAPRDERGDLA